MFLPADSIQHHQSKLLMKLPEGMHSSVSSDITSYYKTVPYPNTIHWISQDILYDPQSPINWAVHRNWNQCNSIGTKMIDLIRVPFQFSRTTILFDSPTKIKRSLTPLARVTYQNPPRRKFFPKIGHQYTSFFYWDILEHLAAVRRIMTIQFQQKKKKEKRKKRSPNSSIQSYFACLEEQHTATGTGMMEYQLLPHQVKRGCAHIPAQKTETTITQPWWMGRQIDSIDRRMRGGWEKVLYLNVEE